MESWERNHSEPVVNDRHEIFGNLFNNRGIYIPGRPQIRGSINSRNEQQYPCNHPQVPYMRTEEVRYMSFFRGGQRLWRADTFATERYMAQTGLFYSGERDKVKCFYCGGRLENWEQFDDPWTEHAKWFPECEFLLRCRGEEFVRNIQHGQLQEQNQQQQLEQQRLEQEQRLREQENAQRQRQERQRQEEEIRRLQEIERQRVQRTQHQQSAARPQQQPTRQQQQPTRQQQQPIRQQQQPTQQQQQPTQQQQQPTRRQPTQQFTRTTTSGGRVTHSTFNIYVNRPEDVTIRNNLPGGGPEIVDPQEERRSIEEIVTSAVESSPLAARARVMGFTNDQIRQAMIRQITENIINFDTPEELVSAIIHQQPLDPRQEREKQQLLTTLSLLRIVDLQNRRGIIKETVRNVLNSLCLLTYRVEDGFTNGQMQQALIKKLTEEEVPFTTKNEFLTAIIRQENHRIEISPILEESEINQLNLERLCKICQQEDACIVFIPCGHLVTCSTCSNSTRRCPAPGCTHSNIEQRIRSYIS